MEESHDISPSFSKPLKDATNIQIFFYFSIYNEFFLHYKLFYTYSALCISKLNA